MCFSNNPTAAVPACAGDGTGGWVVWVDDRDPLVDEATDNNGVPNANEAVVVRHTALPEGIRIKSNPAGNAGYLAFAESGFSRKIEALGERFAGVVMCDSRGNTAVDGGDRSAARGVTVSTTGRPRVTRSRAEILDAGPTMNLGGCP